MGGPAWSSRAFCLAPFSGLISSQLYLPFHQRKRSCHLAPGLQGGWEKVPGSEAVLSVVRVAKRIWGGWVGPNSQRLPVFTLVSPETFQMRRSGIPGHGCEQKSFTTSTLRHSLAQYEGRSFSAVVGCFLLKARQRGAGSFLQPRPQEWYHAQVHSAGRLHPYFLRPGSGLPCCCPAGSLGLWP